MRRAICGMGDTGDGGDPVSASVVPCPSCGVRNRVPTAASGTPRCASCHTDLPWLVEATDADFDRVTDSRLPVLVDLWAPWCGPCRMVGPAVERSSHEFAGRLKVVKVNVDDAPGVSTRLGVQGVPTLLMLRQGRVVAASGWGSAGDPTAFVAQQCSGLRGRLITVAGDCLGGALCRYRAECPLRRRQRRDCRPLAFSSTFSLRGSVELRVYLSKVSVCDSSGQPGDSAD